MNYVLEESLRPCNNTIPIHNCTSSSYESDQYGCEKLFDMKHNSYALWKDSWGANKFGDWAQLNLDNIYHINSIRIHHYTPHNYYRPKNISLQFADGAELNTKLKDQPFWNDVFLPSHVISNYINITIKSKYSSRGGTWTFLSEVQVFGCSSGNIFLHHTLHI